MRKHRPILSLDHEPVNPTYKAMKAALARRATIAAEAHHLVGLELATAASHAASRRKMRRRIDLATQRPTNRQRRGKTLY